MNINQKFKNRMPKSVFRQKSPDQCSCFEIYGDTLWSRHRPQCYNSPIQSWVSSLSKQRPRFPSCLWNWLHFDLRKTQQIGPPAFPNGGRGQPIFCHFNFAAPIILQHLEDTNLFGCSICILIHGFMIWGYFDLLISNLVYPVFNNSKSLVKQKETAQVHTNILLTEFPSTLGLVMIWHFLYRKIL